MRLQQLKDGTFILCLPRVIVRALKWKKFDNLEVYIQNKGVYIIKKR